MPAARWAAAGAKMSLPWNVRDTGASTTSGLWISTADSTPPSSSQASDSSPLSGPTRSAAPAAVAIAPRSDPTPGSTTAT